MKSGIDGLEITKAGSVNRMIYTLMLVSIAGLFFTMPVRAAIIRDGGIDPANLGKGVWIYSMKDATNKLGGHIMSVTNVNSLMAYYKSVGLRYCIIKAGTSDQLFGDCYPGPQFTTNLVNAAHANGMLCLGYNRSYGSNILGEISVANYIFNQGADGLVFDAEAEWESGSPWITNGPAQAWQLCSAVRSNWPTKFLAHSPFAIIAVHATFPYKEFGYFCDAVLPQVYHFSTAGLKGSASAALNWTDVNWDVWQKSLVTLPQTNWAGAAVTWTNAIKPLAPIRDVYGEIITGGIICESAESGNYAARDVAEFTDCAAADPNAATAGGYHGVNFWRADTIGTNQWPNIANASSGNYSNVVNSLVLDDSAATFVGAWNAVKVFGATTTAPTYYGATGADTNCFGTNYCWKNQGGGAAYAEFRPNILIPGKYDVYQWHPFLTNASTGTPFQISNSAGINLFFVNQQTNSGNWSSVGRFNFLAGTNNFIRVLDNFSDATNVAVVDGLKLVYANADLVLDNTNLAVNFSGSWSTGNSTAGFYGVDYCFSAAATAMTATATYQPNFPNAGLYDVFLWYPQGGNRATNAPWTISFFGGSTNFFVNQQTNGGGWFQIASALPFAAGTNGFVSLSNLASPVGDIVMADATRFAFAGPLAPVIVTGIARRGDGNINLAVSSTPGYAVWIDRTTNLNQWTPLTNFLSTNGNVNFTDSSATNQGAGFYRARQ